MQLQHPLATVTAAVDGDVLEVLARSDQEYSLTTLAGLIPHRSPAGIRIAALRLAEQGIVRHRVVGRSRLFTLNRDHLAASTIIELAHVRATFLTRLTEACNRIPQLTYAALFGSAARGEMRTDSDIDLFFVLSGETTQETAADVEEQIHELATRATAWTGNDVRPVIYHEDAIEPQPVLRAIAAEGITICGEDRWLRRRLQGMSA